MPDRESRLTDLEKRTFRHMKAAHQQEYPGHSVRTEYLAFMARVAVEALTTGSASGRRIRWGQERVPDPGCTPDKIRKLARDIESSFHTMPNGWVSADEERRTRG